jgi:hypothetical protein
MKTGAPLYRLMRPSLQADPNTLAASTNICYYNNLYFRQPTIYIVRRYINLTQLPCTYVNLRAVN